jgi:HK97 family phage prohead protease
MNTIILKGVKLETKLSADRRKFEAYASTFGNIDSDQDIILPGAFTKTIAEAFPAKKIKVLWQHNWSQPIGLPTVMQQDSTGLFTETELGRSTLARDAANDVEDGIVDRLSIGFWIPAGKSARRPDGVREISEVALMEYSLVTFPANDQAIVTGVKSLREMVSYFKSGDVSEAIRQEIEREFLEIKALLTGQPVTPTAPDHSRDMHDLAALLKQFKPPI